MSDLDNIEMLNMEPDNLEAVYDFMLRITPEASVDLDELAEAMLDTEDVVTIAWTPENSIAGLIWYTTWDVDGIGVHIVAVAEKWRRKGLGTRLLNLVDPAMNDVRYTMFSVKEDAYEALGFLMKGGYKVARTFKVGEDTMYVVKKEAIKPKKLELHNRLKWRMM